jgi:hypothetical protein
MNDISQLHKCYFFFKLGIESHQKCIDWAIEKLQSGQEGDDINVVLLAGAINSDEVITLVEKVLERYVGIASLDDQFVAGKYIVSLFHSYKAGTETIASLDEKFTTLYYYLGYPNWLTMLSRNCEYATDVPDYLKPFEDEFNYIANLWSSSESRMEFESRYSRDISNQHDI